MKTVALFCGSSLPHNKVQPCNATPHLCAVKMQK